MMLNKTVGQDPHMFAHRCIAIRRSAESPQCALGQFAVFYEKHRERKKFVM